MTATNLPDMQTKYVQKIRNYWNFRAYEMLREPNSCKFAGKILPCSLNGIRIVVPETKIILTIKGIIVRSQYIFGETLEKNIYNKDINLGIDWGLTAIQALWSAPVFGYSFRIFGVIYQPLRVIKALLTEIFILRIFSLPKVWRLVCLLVKTRSQHNKTRVLVHGNLHGGNLIVDFDNRTLGFIDLELLHIGDACVDFASLWFSYYASSQKVGRQFVQSAIQRFPSIITPEFLRDVIKDITIEMILMVSKAKSKKNRKLENIATDLLIKLLNCNDLREL
jgi:thiamine kinase-like enzyme